MNSTNASVPAAVEGLTVRYGAAMACADVSLSVARGAVYALLGRNGAGKSSLVRCLLGQQRPSSGRAMLFGEDVWKARTRLMMRVGVVPEEPDAPPAMTARQIAGFCRRLYPSWDQGGVDRRLERFGVPPGVPFGRLSKGQKGEVMLATALGHGPELLILDDPRLESFVGFPSGGPCGPPDPPGLDAAARRDLYEELIGELADRGTTVFLTTQDLSGVEAIATRVGILKDGHLVLDEETEKLKKRFRRIRYGNERSAERSAFGTELDAFEAVRVRVRGWGIDAVVSNFAESSFEQFRMIDGVVDAEVSPMSLEEIFLAVVGEKGDEGKNT